MGTLFDVPGQARVTDRLSRAIRGDRVAHAYLFSGAAGAGKRLTALAFAKAMNCDSEPGVGCDSCTPCTKIDEGNHPDVQFLERRGAAQTVPIDAVRRQVLAAIGLPPHEARARIFIVEESTAMLGPAANALLKTLEEPPARTHFVLITTAPHNVLTTIRSRCQRIHFDDPAGVRSAVDDDAEALVSAVLEGHGNAAESIAALAKDRERVPVVIAGMATALARRAQHVAVEDPRCARAWVALATMCLHQHRAVTHHNAHGQLALEDLVARMRRVMPG